MLEVKNVRCGYDNNEIIKGVSFNVEPGSNLCIVGPNGCGKSTLLKSIANLLNYKGSILLNKDKFIYKTLIGKIMRLIPGGVTILSIGINSSLARRFTLALGYSMSQLSTTYINLVIENKDIDPLNIFTKEAIEDLMESYLIEYNKTVTN